MTPTPITHNNLTLDGPTLVRRGLRHTLSPAALLSLAEALNDARVRAGTWAAAGFVIRSDGEEKIHITGWDMGPILLSLDEATTLCLALAVEFGKLSPGQKEAARDMASVRKSREPRAPKLRMIRGGKE